MQQNLICFKTWRKYKHKTWDLMTITSFLRVPGLLVSIHGSDAVLDGLEVLGVALEEDYPDSGGVKVDTEVSPLQWNTKVIA